MNPSGIIEWLGRNDRKVFPLLFCVAVLWILPGVLPLVSYEGDAMSICYGCEYTAEHGWHTLGQEGYGFWMQPLTYVFLTAVRRIFDIACEPVYSAFSALCAISLIYISVIFSHKLTGIKRSVILTAILLIPESYELTMYPNSMAPAAMMAAIGMLLLLEGRKFAATAMLCIAPLFRLDVCVIYPVVPFLLYLSNKSIGRSIRSTSILAILVIAAIGIFYKTLGASIATTFDVFFEWTGKVSHGAHFSALLGFYGLITPLLIPVGLTKIIKSRKRILALAVIFACITVHTINFHFGNASKHYATLLPFVGIINAYGLIFLSEIKFLKWIYGLLIVASSTIGIYIFKGPHYGKFGLELDTLMSKKEILKVNEFSFLSPIELSFRFGPGSLIATGDELYSVGGYIYYPRAIHKVKKKIAVHIKTLRNEVMPLDVNVVVAPHWNDYTRIKLENQLTGNKKCIFTYDLSIDVHQADSFNKSVESLESLLDSYSQKNESLMFFLTTPLSYEYRETLDEAHLRDARFAKTASGIYVLPNNDLKQSKLKGNADDRD